jgi:hypothetical protein
MEKTMAMTNKDASIAKKEVAEVQIIEQCHLIKYDTVNYTIDYIVDKLNLNKEIIDNKSIDDGLFVIPDYQRKTVWNDKKRSFFIESLLLGLPLPILFFQERENGVIEIVDGVQRVTTINSFINNNFALQKMTKLTALNRFKFSDFSAPTQRKFLGKSLRVTLLDRHSSGEQMVIIGKMLILMIMSILCIFDYNSQEKRDVN